MARAEALCEEGISWRSLERLTRQQKITPAEKASVVEAHFTAMDLRTAEQRRAIERAQRLGGNIARRQENLGMATGRVPSSSGLRVRINGRPR